MFRAVLYLSLLFTVTVGEILPSILWNPSNPLFDLLGNSARNVMPSDQLPILCPTPYQYPVKMNNFYSRDRLFENLFLVDKAGFDGCNATMGQKILDCKDPVNIVQTTLVFQPASASGPSFKQGKEYYFINTASGLEDSLHNFVGGRCGAGKMKLKIYVCKGASDSKCKDGNDVVHGGWSDWSQCKDGLQTRSCDSPCQANGGIPCIGDSVRQCATKASQTTEGNSISESTTAQSGPPSGDRRTGDNLLENEVHMSKVLFIGICLIVLVAGLAVGAVSTMLLCQRHKQKHQNIHLSRLPSALARPDSTYSTNSEVTTVEA